jgi:hypothetical protein
MKLLESIQYFDGKRIIVYGSYLLVKNNSFWYGVDINTNYYEFKLKNIIQYNTMKLIQPLVVEFDIPEEIALKYEIFRKDAISIEHDYFDYFSTNEYYIDGIVKEDSITFIKLLNKRFSHSTKDFYTNANFIVGIENSTVTKLDEKLLLLDDYKLTIDELLKTMYNYDEKLNEELTAEHADDDTNKNEYAKSFKETGSYLFGGVMSHNIAVNAYNKETSDLIVTIKDEDSDYKFIVVNAKDNSIYVNSGIANDYIPKLLEFVQMNKDFMVQVLNQ